jgi:hypothetical protein
MILFAEKWMELEILILSEISQIQEKDYMFSLMRNIDFYVYISIHNICIP